MQSGRSSSNGPDLTKLVLHFVFACTFLSFAQCSQWIRQKEKDILDDILGVQYDKRIRPAGKVYDPSALSDGPCEVDVNIMVRSISRIDDVKMEFSTQLTFRMEWTDDRLNYEQKIAEGTINYLVLTDTDKIWLPDAFFRNEKKGHFHNLIMPNVLLRIRPSGKTLYSVRISLNLSCPMDLKYFPLDVQTCRISTASYGYTTRDLIFNWASIKPVQPPTKEKLHLPRFSLINIETARCDSGTATGNYSCIDVLFYFKREFSYYLFLIYVPCCMLVIVSWVSFWIDPNSTAARVLLGVTSLLTMSRQISSINAALPPVSYIKAVDVWTECCLVFVFSALIEFAVVNYVSRADAAKAGQRRRRPTMIGARKKYDSGKDSGIESSDIENGRVGHKGSASYRSKMSKKRLKTSKLYEWWVSRVTTRSKKIDVASRIMFPVLFAMFNAFYWTKYLFRDDLNNIDL